MNQSVDDVLDVYVPGAWKCLQCGFALSKATIFVASGTIGCSRDDVMKMEGEICPNDGTAMARETWHERAESNRKWGESLMEDIIAATKTDSLPAALEAVQARFSERLCRHCGDAIRPTGDGGWLDCETHTTCNRKGRPRKHEPVGASPTETKK